MSQFKRLDIPVGRVEFLGHVLHIVEHEGQLVAACNDEHGLPVEAIASPRLDARGCRRLMREAVDLLIEAAEISLMLSAFAANRNSRLQNGRRTACNAMPDNAGRSQEATTALAAVAPNS